MAGPQLDPAKVKKPIQLLAVMVAGLVLLVGSFLTAAAKVEKPPWAAGMLLITAVAIVPIFVGVVVLMWTKFRIHLQDDHYYAEWLKRPRFLPPAPAAVFGTPERAAERYNPPTSTVGGV